MADGFLIPAGTTIGVPTQAISMDPEIYPDPETFDGFRFAKLRSSYGLWLWQARMPWTVFCQ
jgi:ent-kaurene oxidase